MSEAIDALPMSMSAEKYESMQNQRIQCRSCIGGDSNIFFVYLDVFSSSMYSLEHKALKKRI